jgi:HEAT repeats
LSNPKCTCGNPKQRSRRLAAVLPAVCVVLVGCGDQQNSGVALDSFVKKIFEPARSPQQYMILAVSDSDPDIRRESVAKISQSKQSDRDWAVKGYTAIALLESDSQARCVAVRALGQTANAAALETILRILTWDEHAASEVRPPDAQCRWECLLVLGRSAETGLPQPLQAPARDVFLARLSTDDDRHARAAAAAGLKSFPTPEVVDALIAALRDEQFAVVHAAEGALVGLTGMTHGCDAAAWQQWSESNRGNLFARRGQVPDSRRPAYTDKWSKAAYKTRQFVNWLRPGEKK